MVPRGESLDLRHQLQGLSTRFASGNVPSLLGGMVQVPLTVKVEAFLWNGKVCGPSQARFYYRTGQDYSLEKMLRQFRVPLRYTGRVQIQMNVAAVPANLVYASRVRRANLTVLGIRLASFPGYLDPVLVQPATETAYQSFFLTLNNGKIVGR